MVRMINRLAWDISIVPSMSPELLVDGCTCRGTTWYGQQKIYLSSDLTKDSAKLVIAHELVHAFLWSTQMRVPESFNEEEVCEFIARWGNEILTLTEDVFTALYGVDKEN